MRKFRSKHLIIILAVLLPVLLGGFITIRVLTYPPLDKLSITYKAIEEAKRANADIYASDLLASAESLMISAKSEMKRENARWYWIPSYYKTDSLLSEAVYNAELASQTATNNRRFEEAEITEFVTGISDNINFWKNKFENHLNMMDFRKILTKAESDINIAINLLNAQEYFPARHSANKALQALGELDSLYSIYDRQIIDKSETWSKWVNDTINKSKKSGSNAVIVDKSAHRSYLISKGKIIKSYVCDLGYNSGHDKQKLGDGATPEGIYRVTMLLNRSKYYKALRLNYPNANDKDKFEKNRRSGIIGKTDEIGGLIEIHGHGGTGKDWTDGCVAVSDKDMDNILKYIGTGSVVTIVRKSDLPR